MAIAHQFDYLKPGTLLEAVSALARYGSRAQVLAGGTDLVSLIAEDLVRPEAVVDIKGVPGLNKIGSRTAYSQSARSSLSANCATPWWWRRDFPCSGK